MNKSRILVVDDEPGMLRSVERVLSRDYKVESTRSPRDAVEIARNFNPDLAILDVQMPELDGFQVMEKLHAANSGIEVIFMTGSVNELDAKLIQAIRKDAFYFLHKPFDRGVLLTLVERCLERKRLEKANREHLSRMAKELADARAFQQGLLPPQAGNLDGISIFAHYVPCFELAGDFYDYIAIPPDGAVILVADVSGHGASAAMLTGVVKSALHSAILDQYEPGAVVERVASGIRPFGFHHYITLVCVRIRDRQLEFVNAGHPPGILSTREATAPRLEPTGPIISPAFSGFSWAQETIQTTRQSDRIVLFTDAILEAESHGAEYGLERLVQEVGRRPPDGKLLGERILESLREFTGGQPITDDLTVVVVDL